MPKLPRGNGKSGSDTAHKPPAKRSGAAVAKPAAAPKRRAARRKADEGAKPAGDGEAEQAAAVVEERDFEHRPVDEHTLTTPAGPASKLSEDQRVLLGDLFAVVEEHAGEAAETVDRDLVERAFVFAC